MNKDRINKKKIRREFNDLRKSICKMDKRAWRPYFWVEHLRVQNDGLTKERLALLKQIQKTTSPFKAYMRLFETYLCPFKKTKSGNPKVTYKLLLHDFVVYLRGFIVPAMLTEDTEPLFKGEVYDECTTHQGEVMPKDEDSYVRIAIGTNSDITMSKKGDYNHG